MKIISSYKDIKADAQDHVIAIGNFDGVHLGHMALLQKAKDIAKKEGAKVGVLTFEPHPRSLFQPDEPPGRVTPSALKLARLQTAGIDAVYEIPFNWDFASFSHYDFIHKVLIDGVNARHIVIGADFRFGQMRKGTPQDIIDSGIPVTMIDKISDDGGAVYSSSRVRQFLRHGDIKKANEILGWKWEIRGEVIKGDQRGRELGYPTANMKLGDTIHPAYGIYAAFVRIEGEDEWHQAAINIGIRPMFEVPIAQVESHILDFDRDIYGKTLHVRPVKHLRSEAKFDSLDDLIAQMDKDCQQAREILSKESL